MTKKTTVKFLLALLTIAISVGFATTTMAAGNDLEKITTSGRLIVGTSADFPPYEFHKAINGNDEIVGFDISLAEEIAKDLGVTMVVKDMKFDGLLAALTSGNIDIIVSGMTPTAERKKNVDFSEIYYVAKQSVVIRGVDKEKFASVSDLEGKKVGAQMSSLQEKIAKEQIPGSKVKALGRIADLIMELKFKKIDALIVDTTVARSYIEKNKDLKISDIEVVAKDSGSAVAARKGNPELIAAINKTLGSLISEQKIGKFVEEAMDLVNK